MKYILIIIYYSILSTFSVNSMKPNFCVDCKFFRNNFISGTSFGKCSLFPIMKIIWLMELKLLTRLMIIHTVPYQGNMIVCVEKMENYMKKNIENGLFRHWTFTPLTM